MFVFMQVHEIVYVCIYLLTYLYTCRTVLSQTFLGR